MVNPDQLSFPGQDKAFFTYYGGGTRLALVQWHRSESEAHQTLSYVDFTFGKDRLYDFVADGVRHYGLRKMVEARLNIPSLNVRVGADLNLGQGQNEVRILVTTSAVSLLKSLLGQPSN